MSRTHKSHHPGRGAPRKSSAARAHGHHRIFYGKKGKPKDRILIEELPRELQGPSQNRWGGSRCVALDPGTLWQRGRRREKGRVLSEAERKEAEARLKAAGLL